MCIGSRPSMRGGRQLLFGTHFAYFFDVFYIMVCTSGSRGGAPGARPPNGRGPMIFYAQNAIFFSIFFTLATLAINFKLSLNRYMAKTR